MLCGFFPVTLQLWRDRAVESKGSLVIIILLLLHSSPDGPHLSSSPSPSLFPHIPVFISFPSPPDFVSLGSSRQQRKGDRQKHREIERKQKMTKIRWKLTEMDSRMQAGREKEERSCINLTFESLIIAPLAMLVIAKCLWSANTQ